MRILLQPSFILHHRPYRETSVLLDVLTENYGRISLIAKGVRTARSRLRSFIQPFIPLLLSWNGKGELMTMYSVEANGAPLMIKGDCLLSGFYLNELLVKVLQKQDPCPRLYTIYHHTLIELQGSILKQHVLRLFEKKLLEELGYGLQLTHDFRTGKVILADCFYQYYPEHGFEQVEKSSNMVVAGKELQEKSSIIVAGKSLLALAKEQLDDPDILFETKRLMRLALGSLLGYQPLQSKKLFQI